eukprot:13872-Heterococcus_DN1.PRE.1
MSGVSAECNPLRCASGRSCCNKVLQAFLDSGADILISTTAGVTALHTAAAMGLADNCELLLTRESSLGEYAGHQQLHCVIARNCTGINRHN